MTARPKTCVCGHSLFGIAGSNPTGTSDLSVVCCKVEVYVTGRSLLRRSPTQCGVSECDSVTSTMGRPWPTRAVEP